MECEFYDVGCHFSWLIDEIKLLFVFFLDSLLQAMVSLISAIPAPDFLLNATSLNSLPDSVLFYTTLFQVPYGIGIVVVAYTLRFSIRRIPGIG